MNLLRKINQTGWRYSFAILFNRIVPERLFRCRRFAVYQLDPAIAGSESDSSVELQYCENEDQILAVEKLTWVSRKTVSGKSDQVTSKQLRPVQATIEERLVGGTWMASEQFDERELGIRYLLTKQQAWLFGSYVDQSTRRLGVYSKILKFVVEQETDKGHSEILCSINPNNKRSNRVHQKNSTRTLGTVFSIRLLKMTLCFAKGDINCDRRFSFNSSSNPILIKFGSSN